MGAHPCESRWVRCDPTLESTASVSRIRLDAGKAAWVTLKYTELMEKYKHLKEIYDAILLP